MTARSETWILRGDEWYLSQGVLLACAGMGAYFLAAEVSEQEDLLWWLWTIGFAFFFLRRLRHPSRATIEEEIVRFSGLFGSKGVRLGEVIAVRRSDHDYPMDPEERPHIVNVETRSAGAIEIVWTPGVRELAMRLRELNPMIELDLPDGTQLRR